VALTAGEKPSSENEARRELRRAPRLRSGEYDVGGRADREHRIRVPMTIAALAKGLNRTFVLRLGVSHASRPLTVRHTSRVNTNA
jgi:hypothetical protein